MYKVQIVDLAPSLLPIFPKGVDDTLLRISERREPNVDDLYPELVRQFVLSKHYRLIALLRFRLAKVSKIGKVASICTILPPDVW